MEPQYKHTCVRRQSVVALLPRSFLRKGDGKAMPFDQASEKIMNAKLRETLEQVRKLDEVIALLGDKRRWTKGEYRRSHTIRNWFGMERGQFTAYCILGAMNEVEGTEDDDCLPNLPFVQAVEAAVHRRVGFSSIPAFNDSPKITHADVMSVLREARELLETGEFCGLGDDTTETG